MKKYYKNIRRIKYSYEEISDGIVVVSDKMTLKELKDLSTRLKIEDVKDIPKNMPKESYLDFIWLYKNKRLYPGTMEDVIIKSQVIQKRSIKPSTRYISSESETKSNSDNSDESETIY